MKIIAAALVSLALGAVCGAAAVYVATAASQHRLSEMYQSKADEASLLKRENVKLKVENAVLKDTRGPHQDGLQRAGAR